MARYPGATFRDVGAPGNYSNRPMRSYRGAVFHINASSGATPDDPAGDSLYGWITGDHDMSCHFQVSQSGGVEQYIDTAYSSWCQSAGNDDWISIETEGQAGTAATNAQLHAIAGILAWLHETHGIPLVETHDPINGHGFICHGDGGDAWGGHADCPGTARRAQVPTILQLATGGDWFTMATIDDLKNAVRAVLNEGTGKGQASWAGTSKATLSSVQNLYNVLQGIKGDIANVDEAVIAALPPDKDGSLTIDDVKAAVRAVFADAGTP